MTVVHTYFYIVVDTQRGCRTLKLKLFSSFLTMRYVVTVDQALLLWSVIRTRCRQWRQLAVKTFGMTSCSESWTK